jgi:hypothetical protein
MMVGRKNGRRREKTKLCDKERMNRKKEEV